MKSYFSPVSQSKNSLPGKLPVRKAARPRKSARPPDSLYKALMRSNVFCNRALPCTSRRESELPRLPTIVSEVQS